MRRLSLVVGTLVAIAGSWRSIDDPIPGFRAVVSALGLWMPKWEHLRGPDGRSIDVLGGSWDLYGSDVFELVVLRLLLFAALWFLGWALFTASFRAVFWVRDGFAEEPAK